MRTQIVLVDAYEVSRLGIVEALRPYEELYVTTPARETEVDGPVDVLLYEPVGLTARHRQLVAVLSQLHDVPATVYSWRVVSSRSGRGAQVSKRLRSEQLAPALTDLARGNAERRSDGTASHPGVLPEPVVAETDLSARETEVLSLLMAGLSNQEIADRMYVSINSVKTYIRTAYRKIGAQRRSQAILWGMAHGLAPHV